MDKRYLLGKPLELTDELFIGKGRDRVCYQHPIDPSLCIKISIRNNKQSVREADYFQYLYTRSLDLSLLSCYKGEVETNLGKGYMFELVRNHNGAISETLTQMLQKKTISAERVVAEAAKLRAYLINNKICVRDISPSNIVVQNLGTTQCLRVIDGVSNPGVFPWTIRIPCLIARANDKSWHSFHRKVLNLSKTLDE